jgi:hypothetical protein
MMSESTNDVPDLVKCSIQDRHVDPSEEIVFASIEKALGARASLCEAALALREFNTELAERCLKCERAIADAMRGEPGGDRRGLEDQPPTDSVRS